MVRNNEMGETKMKFDKEMIGRMVERTKSEHFGMNVGDRAIITGIPNISNCFTLDRFDGGHDPVNLKPISWRERYTK